MSRHLSLLLCVALAGCAGTDPGTADPDVVDDPVEDPTEPDAFAEHSGYDQPEPPPPGSDPIDDEEWGAPPVEEDDAPLLARQLMVRVAKGVDLGAVAVRHGTKAASPPDSRGYGSIIVPDGEDAQALLEELMDDPDVVDGGRMGLIVGAADGWAVKHQWHHDLMQRVPQDEDYPKDIDQVVVAILDTGVAYEDHTDEDGQRYVAASTLGLTPFVAPWDFVNDDAHPNDDHQHGTHLASLIGSQGEVAGVAPGVSIMPVKVLDHRKRGTELNLVRGIDYAVAKGADVINLSLSFPSGYLPSPLLQRALQDAAEAGVILVGAAGNEGVGSVTWPAASPAVVAVAAADLDGALAPYSNWGGPVDVLAPGGDLTADVNSDGLPDGILGETIALQDPERTGLWLVEGTSQATALASGVFALRIAEGGRPGKALAVVQEESYGKADPAEGMGLGMVQTQDVFDARDPSSMSTYLATIRPFLADWGGGQLQPGVRVQVVDRHGEVQADRQVFGAFSGTSNEPWSCWTDDEGICTGLVGSVVADPTVDALAWTVTVDGVYNAKKHRIVRPRRALLASDALDVVTAAMPSEAAGAVLLFHDELGLDEALDRPLAGSYVSMDLGSGLMSSPMGIVATPPAVAPWMSKQLVGLDVDGTGLMSSPMGVQTMVLASLLPPSDADIALDGSGLLSSPMLGFRPQMAVLGSSGPTGLDINALVVTGRAPALDVTNPAYDGEFVRLDEGTVIDSTVVDSALADHLQAGAWQDHGLGGATVLMGSGQVSVALEGSATTAEAVALPE